MWSDSVVDPGLSLLGGLRDSSLLGGSGTLTAWRTPGPSLLGGLRDPDRNWTGESDRCDRTRLDPELELMFLSRIDVVGLSCGSGNPERNSLAGSGTFSAWRNRDLLCLAEPGPSLLGGVRDFHCVGGLRDLDSLAEPGTAWRTPGLSLLGGIRDLDCLADSGTLTAWRTPGLSLELEQ